MVGWGRIVSSINQDKPKAIETAVWGAGVQKPRKKRCYTNDSKLDKSKIRQTKK
jgi:hypothetical protein